MSIEQVMKVQEQNFARQLQIVAGLIKQEIKYILCTQHTKEDFIFPIPYCVGGAYISDMKVFRKELIQLLKKESFFIQPQDNAVNEIYINWSTKLVSMRCKSVAAIQSKE